MDALPKAWTQLRYHPTQAELWHCPKRFIAVPAGRGSGKTVLAHRKLVLSLCKPKPWSDPKYILCAPTEGQVRRIGWDKVLKLVPPEWIRRVREGDMRIETVFGSSLQLFGLDQPQRVEGDQYDGCVIDESSDIHPGTFDRSILPALSHRKGWCWRIGVPKRFGRGAAEFKQFYLDATSGKMDEAAAFTWSSDTVLSQEELAYARSILDPRDYREQFDAEWISTGGGIFYAFDRNFNVRPCPYDPNRTLYVGSDFNISPMAWVLGHDYGDRLEIFDEIWLFNANTQMALDVLYERYRNHRGGFAFYGDTSSKQRHTNTAAVTDYVLICNDARFRKLGRKVGYLKSNPPIADRFMATNAMICSADGTRRLFVSPACKHLIDDLMVRTYKDGTRQPDDRNKMVGHITDALGYLIYALYPPKFKKDDVPEQIFSMARR